MKYGDTLRQRSIPEWGHYNIDYDYLKDLIKYQTTPGAGKALSIPGQGAPSEKAFGDTFFQVVKAQHDRINLFIRSKSGEIERRLEFISKQLAQLHARRPEAITGSRLPARVIEKYAKIDADVTKAGEEIRSLSRFRIAQRTGFHKILKKYKRWTRDRELERRFKEEVIGSPDSFFQLDLGYLLDQYIDVLSAVRAPLGHSGASNPYSDPNQRSAAASLSQAIEGRSDIDFDVALASIPLGLHGSRAVYWVHSDHIVEVEVLLLQQMRLTLRPASKSSSQKDSPFASPQRRKSSGTIDKYFSNEDNVGVLVLDDSASFAKKQNASTVGSSEETPGSLNTKAAGNARWTSSGEAAVAVGLNTSDNTQTPENVGVARLKRKLLEAFLESDSSSTDAGHPPEAEAGGDLGVDSVPIVRRWLADHHSVKPIAGTFSKRTRFVGLHNSLGGGVWATLDRDIYMSSSLHTSLSSDEWLSEVRTDAFAFPHAVLEIRRESNQSLGLIQTLDRSHLVERVRGFSLEAHAVWACCQPPTMSPPLWLATLDKDIRKLPAPVRRQRRKGSSITDSTSHTSPPQTSTSATSATSPYPSRNGETSATSASEFVDAPSLQAFRKKPRKSHSQHPLSTQAEAPRSQRYWNEYDNPESEEEGYYIYVDPNASVKLPGQEVIESWARKTKKLLRMGKMDDEESPLISAAETGTSDDETTDESPIAVSKSYGTMFSKPIGAHEEEGYFSGLFRSLRNPRRDAEALNTVRRRSERERQDLLTEIHVRQHEREMAKLQLYSSCLAAGAVLDIVLSILQSTSRRKLRGEVDSAIILGVICNLFLLLVAVTSMRTRQERLGWIHQGFVILAVVAMVVVDALMFRWALNL